LIIWFLLAAEQVAEEETVSHQVAVAAAVDTAQVLH
jgi:hypothetical protein